MRLLEKTAIVTGASRGIGKATALALAAEGADVAVNYLDSESEAEAVVAQVRDMGRRSLKVRADVRDLDAVKAMTATVMEEFGLERKEQVVRLLQRDELRLPLFPPHVLPRVRVDRLPLHVDGQVGRGIEAGDGRVAVGVRELGEDHAA